MTPTSTPNQELNSDIPDISDLQGTIPRNAEDESRMGSNQDQTIGATSPITLSDVQSWLATPIGSEFSMSRLNSWNCIDDSFPSLIDPALNEFSQTLQPTMTAKFDITPILHNDL